VNVDNLKNLRVNYKKSSLTENETHADPMLQFKAWLNEAIQSNCDEPNAFTLSTVKKGQPRSRIVLLKELSTDGFIFYTNYESDKSLEILDTPKVAMNFLWLPLERQIRIEGEVSKVSDEISDHYFSSRPKQSQISAIASPQSKKIASREVLEKFFKEVQEKLGNQIERPSYWGGYLVKPTYFEFWQGRENRLHDRISYEKKSQDWIKFRLAP
jgi:pyridoxamine 5'-phosphate oxidase